MLWLHFHANTGMQKKKNAFYAEGAGGSPILEEQEELEAGFTASPAHPGAPVTIYPRMK